MTNTISTEELLNNTKKLSKTAAEMAEILRNSSELQDKAFDTSSKDTPELIRDYAYAVSPWPVVVDKKFIKTLDMIVREIPIIFNTAINHLFSKSSQVLCDYLNITSMEAEMIHNAKLEVENIFIRYDAVISDGLVKLVEANSGSALGGWELGWLAERAIKNISNTPKMEDFSLGEKNVFDEMFDAFCAGAARLKGDRAVGNLLFYLPPSIGAAKADAAEKRFYEVFTRVRPSRFNGGKLFFIRKFDDVQIESDGKVYYQGVEMDAILMSIDESEDVPLSSIISLNVASLKGQFYYPDAAKFTIFGKKLLFALMHDKDVRSILTEQQVQIIDDHIPWSSRVIEEYVDFKGRKLLTSEFVESHQAQLVLKKSVSSRGTDVFVGRNYSKDEWLDLCSKYQNDSDWLFQEFCEPDLVACTDHHNGFAAFKLVWGFFALKGKYAGGFVRGTPSKTGVDVINSARGATEFFLFEEYVKTKELII